MTYYELRVAARAFDKSYEGRWIMASTHAAWIVNMWSKKTIRPEDLYRRKSHDSIEELALRTEQQIERMASMQSTDGLKKKDGKVLTPLDPKRFKSYEEVQAFIRSQAASVRSMAGLPLEKK